MNESVRAYLPAGKENDAFVTQNFETNIIAGNNRSSCKNILSRFLNSFTNTYNMHITIPKWVVIVVEDDIIKTLKPENLDDFKRVTDFLMSTFEKIIRSVTDDLPFKANKYQWPHLLFIEPTLHQNFKNNNARKMMIECLHKSALTHDRTVVLPLKSKDWTYSNPELFNPSRLAHSHNGFKAFWQSFDHTVRFADVKLMRNFGLPLNAIFRKEHIAKESMNNILEFDADEQRRLHKIHREDLRHKLEHGKPAQKNYTSFHRGYQQERFDTQIQRRHLIANNNVSSRKKLF